MALMTKTQYQSAAQAAAQAAAQEEMTAKVLDIVEAALEAAAAHGDGTGVVVSFPYSWNVTPAMQQVAAAGYSVTPNGGEVNQGGTTRTYTVS